MPAPMISRCWTSRWATATGSTSCPSCSRARRTCPSWRSPAMTPRPTWRPALPAEPATGSPAERSIPPACWIACAPSWRAHRPDRCFDAGASTSRRASRRSAISPGTTSVATTRYGSRPRTPAPGNCPSARATYCWTPCPPASIRMIARLRCGESRSSSNPTSLGSWRPASRSAVAPIGGARCAAALSSTQAAASCAPPACCPMHSGSRRPCAKPSRADDSCEPSSIRTTSRARCWIPRR